MSLYTSVEKIMYGREEKSGSFLLRFSLTFLSKIYGFAAGLRNFLFDRNILKETTVAARVICIGNVSVGGTGKTPVTMMTVSMLKEQGWSVAVVSRGYGGNAGSPLVVSDGANILASSENAGDEPLVLARALDGVPVVVGRDRVAAAELAVARFKPAIIVLDDGFQHRKLARNINVITVDAVSPWGNEKLLPRGILRESPKALKRAHAVMVTRCSDDGKRDRLERMIRYYDRRIPIFYSCHMPVALRVPGADEMRGTDTLDGKKTALLSNVANPASFHAMAESLGADVVAKIVMPDHHRYTKGDMDAVLTDVRKSGAEILLMTAKDERNLPEGFDVDSIECSVLDIRAELIDDNGKYLELISPSGVRRYPE